SANMRTITVKYYIVNANSTHICTTGKGVDPFRATAGSANMRTITVKYYIVNALAGSANMRTITVKYYIVNANSTHICTTG
ncbi:hypothetical protein PS014_24795, partial [Shigella sonnei]|nr:hypothetical protein [Shigella sonnei]